MSSSTTMILDQNSNKELDKNQVISKIWKVLALLHKLQQKTFLLAIFNIKRDIISY